VKSIRFSLTLLCGELVHASHAAFAPPYRLRGMWSTQPPPRSAWNNLDVQILNSNPVLAVHDLARSAAWYRDVLGCETRDPDPGNWTFCRSGAIEIMLGRCPEVVPASELGDHSYVAYLRVDDVEAFHARAVSAARRTGRTRTRGSAGSGRDRSAAQTAAQNQPTVLSTRKTPSVARIASICRVTNAMSLGRCLPSAGISTRRSIMPEA
jgi:catechol 2,3-dioxygenase-like lactoylglutathione lyase family enzyme